MSDNLSDYLELKLLEHSTGKTTFTKPTNTYLALFTVSPTDSTAGTEVTTVGTNYSRQAITWGTAVAGAIQNSAECRIPAAAGVATISWGTIVAIGIMDASSAGNLLWYGPLSAAVTVGAGDDFKIAALGLTLSLG